MRDGELTYAQQIEMMGHLNAWKARALAAEAVLNAARAEARPAVDREAVALLACRFMNDSGLDWPEASCRDQLTYIDKPHDGDCTKKPYTCLRCCAEDAYRFADAILALLSPATSPGEGSSQSQPCGAREPISRAATDAEPSATKRASPFPRRGDRMRFMNRNGYDSERVAAAKVFRPDDVLTVTRCDVGSWSHSVWFGEDPTGRGWNGVMFEFVDGPERYAPPTDTAPSRDDAGGGG